jgi:IclR family acetate operon transcriptional repressor
MTHPAATRGAGGPRVLERALGVLGLFTEQRPEWTVAGIGEAAGLPVSTAYRIVRALESHGLLRDVGGGRFRLGVAAVTLGHRAASAFDVRTVLRPVLERLATETHETATLSVLDRGRLGALCVDRIEAARRLRLSLEIGAVVPLHAGAASKALLAFLGESVLEAVLERRLERLAPRTITERGALRAEVERIRERGYALSFEETNEGAWGAAAPVLAGDGIAVAVLGVAAPLLRHDAAVEGQAVAAVLAAAAHAARRLGG